MRGPARGGWPTSQGALPLWDRCTCHALPCRVLVSACHPVPFQAGSRRIDIQARLTARHGNTTSSDKRGVFIFTSHPRPLLVLLILESGRVDARRRKHPPPGQPHPTTSIHTSVPVYHAPALPVLTLPLQSRGHVGPPAWVGGAPPPTLCCPVGTAPGRPVWREGESKETRGSAGAGASVYGRSGREWSARASE